MRRPTCGGFEILRIGMPVLAMGCLAAGLAAGAAGAESAGETAVTAKADERRIEWHPRVPVEKTMLRVWGEGQLIEADFEAGTIPAFDFRDRRGKPLPDGAYQYRLTVVPELDDASRRGLAQRRARVDADAVGDARSREPFIVSGTFSIRNGALVEHDLRKERIPHERPLMPSAKAGGDLLLWGDLTVRGASRVVALDPESGQRSLHYAVPAGPEVGTYFRGTARLSGGEAVVELPAHFAHLTEERGITVQLTPVGSWSLLYVAEKSSRRLVVRQADGDGDSEFDFLVQGVRSGYAGFEVERELDEEWVFPEVR